VSAVECRDELNAALILRTTRTSKTSRLENLVMIDLFFCGA